MNDPNSIVREYSTDGRSVETWPNALYTGALVVPGMIASSTDEWITNGAWEVASFSKDNYYNDSWKVLYLLTLSGGLQNYWGPVNANTAGGGKPVGAEGHRIPLGWSVSTTASKVVVTVPASASAQLVDASGMVRASSSGISRIELARPAEQGVFFAVVRSEGQQAVVPVTGN
jgi:hypothetical protein